MNVKQVVTRGLCAAAFISWASISSAHAAPIVKNAVARQAVSKSGTSSGSKAGRVSSRATLTTTNGILTVGYDDSTGQFTIRTGANHPQPNETVFFGIGTSYITLRDATSKVMWVNDSFAPSAGLAGYTADTMTSQPHTTSTITNGFRTVYTLPNFEVTQDVVINGTTLGNTNVLHQVKVRNTGTVTHSFGLRYMWDWQIAGNDASLFRPRSPDGAFTSVFATFDNPDFKLFEEVDDPALPTFSIFGSVSNLGLNPDATKPDQLRYAAWFKAVDSAWDFTNTGGNSDSAVVYYWGFNSPIDLAPDASQTFAQYVTTQLSAIASTVHFSAPTYTVSETGPSATINIVRDGDATGAASVLLTTSNGTASAGSDYTAVNQTVNFAAGETSKTVTIPIISDAISDPNETVNLTLSNPVNVTLDAPSTAVLTISDVAPVTLSIADATAADEGSAATPGSATFNVTLSAASTQNVTVNYTTNNGTAVAGSDFVAASGTLTFAPNETTKTIKVNFVGDAVTENNENFTVTLSQPAGATLARTQASATIINDDVAPTPDISINDVTVTEGNTGTVNAVFTVTLSTPTTKTVTLNYATANGTALAPGDYTAASGTINFAPNETTKTITVVVRGDTTDEPNENFVVNLSNVTNANVGDGQGQGTIVDDEGAPQLSIANASVVEGNTGTANMVFTVTLAPASGQTVTVTATAANGSAKSPGDYTATTTNLTFASGETTKTVTVPVAGDNIDEVDEVLYVLLSAPTNAAIATGGGRGIGTIKDDDATPTVTIEDVSIGEGNSGGRTAVFKLTLSAPSGQLVKVTYSTSNGTAIGGDDFVNVGGQEIAFTVGQTVTAARVIINGDVKNEANETFFVNLSNAIGASLVDKQANGVILNDDSPPAITVNDPQVLEGNSGNPVLAFTVSLSAASGQTVTVNYATANGSARFNSDYLAVSGTLSFAPGETSKTINVPILPDTVVEGNETLYMLLTNSGNSSIGKGRGTGTIVNDDKSG